MACLDIHGLDTAKLAFSTTIAKVVQVLNKFRMGIGWTKFLQRLISVVSDHGLWMHLLVTKGTVRGKFSAKCLIQEQIYV